MNKSTSSFFVCLSIISLIVTSCSKSRESTKVLYFSGEREEILVEQLHEIGTTNEWEIIVTDNENYLSDDSLAQVSAVVFPFSSLNRLKHQSIPAIKRYLEAGAGGILTFSDTLLLRLDYPWIQAWDEQQEGSKWEMDEGRLIRISAHTTSDELEESLSYVIGKNSLAEYSKAISPNFPDSSRYTRSILGEGLDEPLEMVLLPERDVLFIERKGGVKYYDDATKEIKTIANFDVFSGIEDGLLGVAAHPDFKENNWLYFYYSVAGEHEVNRLSRFDLIGDSLAMGTEKVMLEIPTQRIYCCHSAGYLAFDAKGDLYLSTGDNTNAEDPLVEGYPPVDERPGHELADDQATAANTDNLKGKILRITPENDGSYSIPDGNLFPKDGSKGRPEIYIMGVRNPFRFTIDEKTNYLYWGDVGPDTKVKNDQGEFMSFDEINQARVPGFYGWPYFLGNNQAFPHYDYATKQEGPKKDPAQPINDSPNNTGERLLPPAQEAMIWYGKGNSKEFPLVGNGGATAMVGPVFYSDLYPETSYRLSDYYHGKLIIYEWIRGWIMAVTLDEQGEFLRMEPFLDHLSFSAPVDIQISSEDGAIYVLEYGTNWFSKNTDAKLSRIEYKEGNRNPIARISKDKQYGAAPLEVQLSGRDSKDYDEEDGLNYTWKIAGKEIQGEELDYTFTEIGVHEVELHVTDGQGGKGLATTKIYVGNTPPEVAVQTQSNRSFYWDHSELDYRVLVKDVEDQEVDPERLNLSFGYVARGKDVAVILSGSHNAATLRHSEGQQLIASSDCKACHAMDDTSVGPSYREISKKYAEDVEVVNQLVTKIIEGGSGVWGAHYMSPHPELSKEDAAKMVKYILSLSENSDFGKLPQTDTIVLKEHIGQGTEGSYLFNASYTDKGANGIEALENRDYIILNHPLVQAEDFDEGSVRIGTSTTNDFYAYARASDSSYLMYKEIDLKNIHNLKLRIRPLAAGKIDVRLDDIEGPIVGSVYIPARVQNDPSSWKEVDLPLEEVQGIQQLYFVFTGEEENEQLLFDIDWIYFSNQ